MTQQNLLDLLEKVYGEPVKQPYHDDGPRKHGATRQVGAQPRNAAANVAPSAPAASPTLPARPYAGKSPRVAGSPTSAAAGDALEAKLGNLQRQVILALDMFGPLSDEALDRVSHVTKTLRPRRVELTRAGYIEDSGGRMKAESGLTVALWSLTEAGSRKAAELKDNEETK